MVDPVVRAKLAVWLMENGAWDEIDRRWRFGDGTADDIASRLLGLPPSVRAQLLGIEGMDIEYETLHRDDFPEGTELEGGLFWFSARRYVTSWQPFDPPVGVAGRNQPNPKETRDA